MFTLPPPRTPETPPTPCPCCQARQAVDIYATSRVHYFRCVVCARIWPFEMPEHTPALRAA
jgi:hypothetical protein